ncbi:MAG: oligosaccharide flippase family protein [Solirubrobacteraceae bacterium]
MSAVRAEAGGAIKVDLDHGAAAETVAAPNASLETVARGVSWTVVGRAVGQGSWYGSLLALAILVPPSAFGAVAVGSVIVAITTLLMESGTGGAIVVASEVTAGHLRRAVLRTGSAALVMCAVAAVLAGPIMRLFAPGGNPNVLRVMLLAVVLAAFSIVPMALLKKMLQFRRQALVLIGAAIAASVLAIGTAVAGAGVWALVTRIVAYQGFVTALAWVAVLDLLPRRHEGSGITSHRRRATSPWFMVIALAAFSAQTFDNLIVGHFTNVRSLGLYAMAFALGLAPTTQISWQIGGVLFPAMAATRDPTQLAQRTLKAMRLMALILLPLVPPAVILAPTLIPAVMGHKWAGMVTPFQVLIVVGIVQGIMNVMAEALAAGRGLVARAWIDGTWATLTIAAVVIGVKLGGITGAAYGHLVMLVVVVAAYLCFGASRVGLTARAVIVNVRGPAAAVLVQAACTSLLFVALRRLDVPSAAAACAAAVVGFGALALVLRRAAPELLAEVREVVQAALRRRKN